MNLNNLEEKVWIAGPCAAENREQVLETAFQLRDEAQKRNLKLFAYRAGAWKIRSTPDSFEGAGNTALTWLQEVQDTLNIPVCVEVVTANHVEVCAKHNVKMFWVGARTSVNPAEIQKIADAVKNTNFTVMVKNPIITDLKLWIGNIERFLNANVKSVMAIHRGFADISENILRNSPMWEIPIDLKVKMPHLPIFCDPSHITGNINWIQQISQIAINYGFNGLMLETHNNPKKALSDSSQQLTPTEWGELISSLSLRSNIDSIDLEKLRSKLQNIDNQLSELLYQRMTIVDEIAKVKKENNISVVQPKQWEQVVKRYKNHSEDTVYQEFINDFLELLHQNSIRRQ